MPSFRKNLVSVYTVNILNGMMGVLLIPLSLHYLGAEGYGLFSIYTVIASFVALLDVGVGKSLQRALSQSDSEEEKSIYISVACGAYLVILTSLIVLMPALLFVIPKYFFPVEESLISSLQWIVFLACIEYLLFIPLAINQSICFAKESFDKHAKFSLISGIARYAILFAAIWIFESVVIVVAFYVLRRLIDQYISSKIIGHLPPAAWKPIFKRHRFRELGIHAIGLSTTRLLQTTLLSMGSFLVNKFFGLESLGHFRAAFDLASKVWFVSNGLGLIIYPKLVRAFSSRNQNKHTFEKLYLAMNLSWVAFALFGSLAAVAAGVLLPLLKITDATVISLFLPIVLGVCINAHANLGYEVLQASAKYRQLNILSTAAMAMIAIIFFWLAPKIGLISIAWAWLISQFAYGLITDYMTLSATFQSSKKKINSMSMRAASIILSTFCIIAMRNELGVYTLLMPLAVQFLFLAICMISFKNADSEFSNA